MLKSLQERDVRERDGVSVWRLIGRGLRSVPTKAKNLLIISFFGLDAGVALALWDMTTGPPEPDEMQRLAVILTAVIGAAFLMVAQVLHQVSQGRDCTAFELPNPRSHTFHANLIGLPLLGAISASLFALSIGVLVVGSHERPIMVVLLVVLIFYLYQAVALIAHTSRFLYKHATEQAEAAARAQAQATEAQLAALRAQMNPHFLFNALNTVAALVRTNGKEAEHTVEHLSEVLRRTLDRTRSNFGTVAEEIDYLRAYLGVEQQRYGQRLTVDWSVADDALALALPPLTLQPLVENALRHGIGSKLEGGRLAIAATRNNGTLHLSVSDDGVGFPARYREGTGLGNLRQRLATLYPQRHDLVIDSSTDGSRITLTLPAAQP
jgi:two-component sensor histidine kinase